MIRERFEEQARLNLRRAMEHLADGRLVTG